MWYMDLLKHLAGTICNDERNAVEFINNLFNVLRTDIFYGEKLEPLMIFGVINDLYKYSLANNKKTSLEQFAEKCIGLIVIHAKYSGDFKICCDDFIEIIKNKSIASVLKLNDELRSLHKRYIDGTKKNKEIEIEGKIRNINQFIFNRKLIHDAVLTDVVKRIEKTTFAELDFYVRVPIDDIVMVLNILLNQMDNTKEIVADLYNYLLEYLSIEPGFDQLIFEIDRNLSEFGVLKEHLNESDKDDQENGISNSKMVVTLVLKSSQPVQDTEPNPAIINICKQLDDYAKKAPKANSFFISNSSRYREGVACILQQIKNHEFLTVESILEQLKTIRILDSTDELVSIIESISRHTGDQEMKSRDMSACPLP